MDFSTVPRNAACTSELLVFKLSVVLLKNVWLS